MRVCGYIHNFLHTELAELGAHELRRELNNITDEVKGILQSGKCSLYNCYTQSADPDDSVHAPRGVLARSYLNTGASSRSISFTFYFPAIVLIASTLNLSSWRRDRHTASRTQPVSAEQLSVRRDRRKPGRFSDLLDSSLCFSHLSALLWRFLCLHL